MKKYAQQGTPSLFGVGEPSPLGDSHPRTGQLPAGGPRYRTTTLSHRPPSEQGQFWKWPLFCRIQEMGGGDSKRPLPAGLGGKDLRPQILSPWPGLLGQCPNQEDRY